MNIGRISSQTFVRWRPGVVVVVVLLRSCAYVQAGALDRWHWRNPSLPLNPLNAVAFSAGKFVAVGGWQGAVFSSADATNWTQEASGSDQVLNGITFGGGLWVAVGSRGAILTSPDGTCWVRQ